MGKLVTPTVHMVGYSVIDAEGLKGYLEQTDNLDFWTEILETIESGLSNAEVLCSLMAKLCYASLTTGKNKNVTKVRDIRPNLINCFNQGHGSVFEHASINFIATNCSRVFTHELVRHRVGTAFSQTSGRFVRGDSMDIVFDPILEPVRAHVLKAQKFVEEVYREAVAHMQLDDMEDTARKKKITSALRRILFNGQSNEIGFTLNLRTIRHVVMLRTAASAEWEIRLVFQQVYLLLKDRFPLLFYGATVKKVDGLLEVSNMKIQPWEAVSLT